MIKFSFSTLGIALTVSIALFTGKTNMLHRQSFMEGVEPEVPAADVLNQFRVYQYGWSFVLACICVFLSFTEAWVWLSKAQDLEPRYSGGRDGGHCEYKMRYHRQV